MKKLFPFLFIILALVYHCNQGYAQNKLATDFDKFTALFPLEKKPFPYAVGKSWLNKQPKQAILDNIIVKKYISVAKVWTNNLQKSAIPEYSTFYPVAQIKVHANFYSFLVATSQSESADVYLLTYNKEGKFVDGICVITVRPPEIGISRSAIFAGGMVLMVKEMKQGKANLFTYDIWDIGTLHGKL